MPSLRIDEVRAAFPALKQKVNGSDLVYLDSAATTLKPLSVIERMTKFYSFETANVHRGAHFLSDAATNEFEAAREGIRRFLGADSIEEIIFTRGTTEGINLVAQSYARRFLKPGDEVVLTEMEHHSNIVPWQAQANELGFKIRYIPVNESGDLDLSALDDIITANTKLVAFSGCSNILGTLTPIDLIVQKAKSVGAVTMLDAAQLVSQKRIDVKKLGVDFLVFSAHKLFGPFGFGVLYGRKALLNEMPPYQYGGSMIANVGFFETTYNHLPFKFEAGTPHVSGAVGTLAAINFIEQYGLEILFEHEQSLLNSLCSQMNEIDGIKLFGTANRKAAIVSFNLTGAHHSDVGQILDQQGIAVRVGHHCTQPLLKKFGLTGTVRASISIYNNQTDIDRLIEGLKKARRMLL